MFGLVKILHTADFHIGAELSGLGALAEARRYEALETFKRMVNLCEQENVDFCLICGDLFDCNKVALQFADSVLSYINSAKNVQFLYVAGNHDPLDASSPFLSSAIPENLCVFGTEYEVKDFPEKRVRFIGKSFSHSSMESKALSRELLADEFINIMLLHADLFADKQSPYNPIDRDFIESSGVDYIALGHIHKTSNVLKLGNTFLAYPGCPEGQGFDENGVKGVYFGEIDKDSCNLSFKRLSRRVLCVENIDISAACNSQDAANIIAQKIKETYGENFYENLYKINLVGRSDFYFSIKPAEILAVLSPLVYFIKLENNLKPNYDLNSLKNDISLKGIFVKKMLEKIETAKEEELSVLEDALFLGLEAFERQVSYNED